MKKTNMRTRLAVVGSALIMTAMASSGCLEGDLGHKFRAATAAELETALTSIATGFIDGAVSIYTPASTTTSTN